MAKVSSPFGRVDGKGNVSVLEGKTWRAVGSYPDGSESEALGYFERKFDELEAKVTLAEQRLAAKAPAKDLSKQVEKLTKELVEPSAVGDLDSLRTRTQAVMGAMKELQEAQKQEFDNALEAALKVREKIVVEMEELSQVDVKSIRWKATGEKMTQLFEAWQNHQQSGPRIPKKTADELWARFRQSKNLLEKARRAHFQELDAKSKESKTIKRALILEAEALAGGGAEGVREYQKLLIKWKKAPRAQKGVEDALWNKFKVAGDVLYQEKAKKESAEDAANEGNMAQKLSLIKDFEDLLSMSDPREAAARFRLFNDKFAAVGPVPRKKIKTIDLEVKKFESHVRNLDEKFWANNDPEKQARSSSMAEQLKQGLSELEQQLDGSSGSRREDLEAEIKTKKEWLAVLDL